MIPLTEAPPPPARPRAVAAPADSALLDAWALDETAFWRLNPRPAAAVAATWLSLNETSRSIFLYRFASGAVDLLPKSEALAQGEAALQRSRLYLAFFRTLLPLLPADFAATLAVETNDRLVQVPDVPVFCFQKHRGDRCILLPDIDFLLHDFYQDPGFQDRLAYADKADRAIFVGSTSGGIITPDIARTAALPRLRAARFFAGRKRVEFLLPQIVQTTNEEARALLAAMPFCQVPTMSWQEQLMRRFLISMDGNGATCSRVAIALASGSVLLKYESEHVLYYFRGLQPWLHYVPVSRDEDVERIMDLAAAQPGTFETMTRNARRFSASTLSRDAVTRYTIRLLLLYRDCLSDEPPADAVLPAPSPPASIARVVLLAHLENQGDTQAGPDGWVGRPGSGLAIEGFSVSFADSELARRFMCRTLFPDGTPDEPVAGGHFCGTRSRNQPLHGFVIDAADGTPKIAYEAAFTDGFRSGPLEAGAPCRAPSGARLEAMRVILLADAGS